MLLYVSIKNTGERGDKLLNSHGWTELVVQNVSPVGKQNSKTSVSEGPRKSEAILSREGLSERQRSASAVSGYTSVAPSCPGHHSKVKRAEW